LAIGSILGGALAEPETVFHLSGRRTLLSRQWSNRAYPFMQGHPADETLAVLVANFIATPCTYSSIREPASRDQ